MEIFTREHNLRQGEAQYGNPKPTTMELVGMQNISRWTGLSVEIIFVEMQCLFSKDQHDI